MRQILLIFLGCTACVSAAVTIAAADKDEQKEAAAVVAELSHRSGLPDSELRTLLADCSASQQSMYICAWRDQLSAERSFVRLLEEKKRLMPQCQAALAVKVSAWQAGRDRHCERAATKNWEGGSMKLTAQAICIAKETERMEKQLNRMRDCKK